MRVAVVGAGLIGLNVGGRLVRAGHDVTFFGRLRYRDLVREHGLRVSGLSDEAAPFLVPDVKYESDLALLDRSDWDYVLVTLKAIGTPDVGAALKGSTRAHKIVSFQNGVDNAAQLRAAIASSTVQVFAGMVIFNVILLPPCHFHQASGGDMFVDDAPDVRALADALTAAGMPCHLHADMRGVLYSKLLFNLNNAINAIAGIPLKQELSQHGYRYVLACLQREAHSVYAAAGIVPANITGVPAWLITYVLQLPDWLFPHVARTTLRIDESAESSMADDLANRRTTEVEQLNGEIVRLGRAHGVPTPFNSALLALVHQAEQAGAGSPRLSADALLASLESALQATSDHAK